MKFLMSNLIIFYQCILSRIGITAEIFLDFNKNENLKILKINLLSLENFETLSFLLWILLAEITFKDAHADDLQ